jgi:cysteine desulfurase
MNAYLDNAASTPLDPLVLEEMMPYLQNQFGNPSSIHMHGRKTRTAIERARKKVAEILNAAPAEIFFTSGGTESDNTAIRGAVEGLGVKHVITSPLEHHAVEHTIGYLEKKGLVQVSMLEVDKLGNLNLDQLKQLLEQHPGSLVSLMHGNNEIGNMIDLQYISEICASHRALFHSDTVQTMGHFRHDLQELKTDFIVGSAHKFHGPKGVGFIYVRPGKKISPFIHGGAQERNMRGGSENLYGIVGLAKALEIAYLHMDEHRTYIEGLKSAMIQLLSEAIPGVEFNGKSAESDSLYTVLNVSLPPTDQNDMILFNLDIAGISASGGSACSSGTNIGSHVLTAIGTDPDRPGIRFSFSKYTTLEEIKYAVSTLADLYKNSLTYVS